MAAIPGGLRAHCPLLFMVGPFIWVRVTGGRYVGVGREV